MFTDSVATRTVSSANRMPTGLSIFAASRIGSHTGSPYTAWEPEVTSTDRRAKSVIVVGRPSAWPRIWARWLPPKRVKSGMLSARVDQNPIMPISDGKKTFQNPPPHPSLDGWSSSGPSPPALTVIQTSSASAPTMTNGAAQFSKRRSASIPRAMMAISSSQNSRNESHWVHG